MLDRGRERGRQMSTWQHRKRGHPGTFFVLPFVFCKMSSSDNWLSVGNSSRELSSLNHCSNCALASCLVLFIFHFYSAHSLPYWIINSEGFRLHCFPGGLQLPKISIVFSVGYNFEKVWISRIKCPMDAAFLLDYYYQL